MKRLTLDIDDHKHTELKSKAVIAGVSMRDILDTAISDYLSGKYKPVVKKATRPIINK